MLDMLRARLDTLRRERADYELRANLMAAQMRGGEAVLESLIADLEREAAGPPAEVDDGREG